MHISWIKSPENENSERAKHTDFNLIYFLDGNGKRRKKIEKEFHRN